MTNKVLLKREKAIIEASEKREVRRNKIKRLVDAVEKREEYEFRTSPIQHGRTTGQAMGCFGCACAGVVGNNPP